MHHNYLKCYTVKQHFQVSRTKTSDKIATAYIQKYFMVVSLVRVKLVLKGKKPGHDIQTAMSQGIEGINMIILFENISTKQGFGAKRYVLSLSETLSYMWFSDSDDSF